MTWSKLKRNKTNWKTQQDKTCSNIECRNVAKVKGLCIYHYNIWRIYKRQEEKENEILSNGKNM